MRGRLLILTLVAVAVLVKVAGPAAPENVRVEDAVPFAIRTSTRVASAPVKVKVEARYDPQAVRGGLCIIADGVEYHSSCWESQGLDAPLRVVWLTLGRPGEYAVQMLQVSGNGKRSSNVEQLLLQ